MSQRRQPTKHDRLLKPSFRTLAHRWWPVLVWLGVIRLESTDFASANNTSSVLYTVIAAVVPHVDESFVSRLDEILRKTGHFAGYGILSALVFLALKNTNRDRLRLLLRRTWGTCWRDFWRWDWVLLGMLVTVVTAAADEIHQTFIPSRTGAMAGRGARHLRCGGASGDHLLAIAASFQSPSRPCRTARAFLHAIVSVRWLHRPQKAPP